MSSWVWGGVMQAAGDRWRGTVHTVVQLATAARRSRTTGYVWRSACYGGAAHAARQPAAHKGHGNALA